MTKNLIPADDLVGRLESGAIGEIQKFCKELFERKCQRSGSVPGKKAVIEVRIRALGMEMKATPVEVSIPSPIRYASSGRLTHKIGGHEVCVTADGKGHFRALIDGKLHKRLSRKLVEKELGIEVQQKSAGGASEPIPRAVWRHLANSYNLFDTTAEYDRHYDGTPFHG